MKKTTNILLIIATLTIFVSACAQKAIEDNKSLIENKNSQLIPLLLSRQDFDANWITEYGEVTQHIGGDRVVMADEYASYFLITTHIPSQTYFTFIHGIYFYENAKPDINKFLEIDKRDSALSFIGELSIFNNPSRCFTYNNSNKQTCLYVTEKNKMISALSVTTPNNLSKEEIIEAVTPIINIIETKLNGG